MAAKRKLTRSNSRQVAAVHQKPGVEPLVPEIRSDIKWKPTPGVPAPFATPASPLAIIAVWNFGVPFKEMDKLHKWLRANEMALAGQLKSAVDAHGRAEKVFYLGTYLNIDSGTPMYQTHWGYTSEEAVDKETAWPDPLPPSLRDLIVELRGHWVRDPARSESRYGLASNYANLTNMPNNPVMLQITIDAAK
ncbi:MAG: hypothetical protein JWN13_2807 [Betaproteobacteria bacterium]|nr:hypothetical protein [Betaproteobacteria bacterium]